jgi:hypothetical protein
MIPAVTINDVLAKIDLSRIDVLKVDIEGAEEEVFRSSELWIDRVDAIIIELHDRHTPGCSGALFRATEDFDIETRRGENLPLMRTRPGVPRSGKRTTWQPGSRPTPELLGAGDGTCPEVQRDQRRRRTSPTTPLASDGH